MNSHCKILWFQNPFKIFEFKLKINLKNGQVEIIPLTSKRFGDKEVKLQQADHEELAGDADSATISVKEKNIIN